MSCLNSVKFQTGKSNNRSCAFCDDTWIEDDLYENYCTCRVADSVTMVTRVSSHFFIFILTRKTVSKPVPPKCLCFCLFCFNYRFKVWICLFFKCGKKQF